MADGGIGEAALASAMLGGGDAAAAGLGGGTAALFAPTSTQLGLLGSGMVNGATAGLGGGTAAMFAPDAGGVASALAGLGPEAGMPALGASNAALGSPSPMAALQGFARRAANVPVGVYGQAAKLAGMGQQPQPAPAVGRPPAGPPPVPSSQILGQLQYPQGGSAAMVGNRMGGIPPQLLAQLLQGGYGR